MNNKTIEDYEKDNILDIEAIIKDYNSYIYTIIKNNINNKEDIEEIVSDVFIIFWKNYSKLNNSVQVRPYLIGITRKLILKKYRKFNNYNNFESIENYENEISNYINTEELAEKNEKSKIISNLLDSIKDEEQDIFIRFYYKSNKIKDISKDLNISQSKVKITLHRVRKLIKKKLKESGYNYGK